MIHRGIDIDIANVAGAAPQAPDEIPVRAVSPKGGDHHGRFISAVLACPGIHEKLSHRGPGCETGETSPRCKP